MAIKRRNPFRSIAVFVIVLAVLLPACKDHADDQIPNIIYILVDDLGYGDLSINGQEKFITPNIDALAISGMSFTNHYSGSTVCAPSRCCLLTGMHTGSATIRQNFSAVSGDRVSLMDEDFTIAEMLKEKGYATSAFGKWGLGEIDSEGVPWEQGFDYWYGYINQKNAHDYFPPFLYENDQKVILDGNMNGRSEDYSHDLIMDKSFDYIKQHRNEPMFVYLAVTLPHSELLIPDKYMTEFRGRFSEKPFINQNEEGDGSQAEPHAAYAAMITKLDSDIGRLRKLLEDLNIDKNTLILFASDNGSSQSGGADPAFFNSNGPFRGIKRDLYEGGIRTPFYVCWPGKIEAGQSSNHISAFWDVLPTLADITQIDLDESINGISFYNTLFQGQQETHDHLYWEFVFKGEARQAARKGKWKAVRYGLNNSIELYDLVKDPGESSDIAEGYPLVIKEFEEIFINAHKSTEDFPLEKRIK